MTKKQALAAAFGFAAIGAMGVAEAAPFVGTVRAVNDYGTSTNVTGDETYRAVAVGYTSASTSPTNAALQLASGTGAQRSGELSTNRVQRNFVLDFPLPATLNWVDQSDTTNTGTTPLTAGVVQQAVLRIDVANITNAGGNLTVANTSDYSAAVNALPLNWSLYVLDAPDGSVTTADFSASKTLVATDLRTMLANAGAVPASTATNADWNPNSFVIDVTSYVVAQLSGSGFVGFSIEPDSVRGYPTQPIETGSPTNLFFGGTAETSANTGLRTYFPIALEITVPEPSAVGLVGLAGLTALRRRRKI